MTDDFRAVEKKRIAFAQAMKQYIASGNKYLNRAPVLGYEHLQGCEILPNRFDILKRLPRHGRVAEVGVDSGDFSVCILETAMPSELMLIDIDTGKITAKNRRNLEASGVAQIMQGDSSTKITELEDESMDWIYIDGDHKYDGVKKDIEAALRKVKMNGLLVFNDYTVWSPQSMGHCGVARAVNELCISDGWRLVYLCLQPLFYNDVVIARIGSKL